MTLDDVERSIRYAKDLTHGLKMIRKYPPGVTVFGSARLARDTKYYKMAYDLGKKMAENEHPIITGGGPGIMEAANRGAFENGGKSIGLNIHLETEQDLNLYTTDSMEFHYFFARKVMLTCSSKVYVFFPGGFGTIDEFAEILELVHTGKVPRSPLFLVGSDFWKGLDDWFSGSMSRLHLIETGTPGELSEISAADAGIVKKARDLYTITDDIDEIVAITNQLEPKTTDDIISGSVEQML